MKKKTKVEIWIEESGFANSYFLRIKTKYDVYCPRCGENVPKEDGIASYKIFINPESLRNDIIKPLDGDLIRDDLWYGGAFIQ